MREFAPGALVSLHSHNSNDRAGNRRDAGKDKQCQVHSSIFGSITQTAALVNEKAKNHGDQYRRNSCL